MAKTNNRSKQSKQYSKTAKQMQPTKIGQLFYLLVARMRTLCFPSRHPMARPSAPHPTAMATAMAKPRATMPPIAALVPRYRNKKTRGASRNNKKIAHRFVGGRLPANRYRFEVLRVVLRRRGRIGRRGRRRWAKLWYVPQGERGDASDTGGFSS